jgi:glycosyltransferase involved in cell wall biosynthesis
MKISVIIPLYNVEKYIERCLKSILNQSFQDFEIVIVNDASPDNSLDIAKNYANTDNRIRIFENPENMGPMWTRKVGYEHAHGDFFVFCDSDDYMPENALELLYNAIVKDNADIVAGAFQQVPSDKTIVQKAKLSFGNDSLSVYKSLLSGELLQSVCGRIYRRELFDNYEYDTFLYQTNGEDGILLYQIVKNIQKMTLIDDVVYCYWANPASSTHIKINEENCKKFLIAQDYVYHTLVYVNELYDDLNRYTIRLFAKKIKSKYGKNNILKYSTIPNAKMFFSWKTLSRYYKGVKLVYLYLLMNLEIFSYYHGKLKSLLKYLHLR